MAPDQLPATDPAAVVVVSPGQGISAAPPQPPQPDLPDSAECDLDLLLQDEGPIDVDALSDDDCCMVISPVSSVQAHVAPPQPPSPPRTQAPAPSVLQPPAANPPSPDMTGPSSDGAGPSRPRRRYSTKKDRRTVTRSWDLNDGAPPPDTWMWRKYGQKGIKGSPHVRSYYKCSTDKQCTARKYVERCRDDSRYLVVSYTGEHTHDTPLNRSVAVTRNNDYGVVNPPLPPPPVVPNITAVAQAAEAPAPPPSVTPASLSPTAPPPAPPSPFPRIPAAVKGKQKAPAPLPALPAASLSRILKTLVEESRKAPAPPAIAASASLSPTTPLRLPSAGLELDVEDYRDASAVTMMIVDADKPQDGGGLPLPMPEELAPVHHGAPGGGSNYNMVFPASYDETTAAGSSSSGDGSTRTAAPVPAPIGNLVDDTFCQQEPWGSFWYWP
ncbi:hypothetical protein PVAP13_4KG231300 [Panicum virgatum]|uniref:WRKY domain-containing protein n=1 Tax=Panicum virgatum TaxID=38727 RepID=A0A8T0TNL8_PANVG|nr:hypothetical protein PVAP13_4KG231300 [Panicum virgatum]